MDPTDIRHPPLPESVETTQDGPPAGPGGAQPEAADPRSASGKPVPLAVRVLVRPAVTAAFVLAAVSIAANGVAVPIDISAGEGFSPADTLRVFAGWAALAAWVLGYIAAALLMAVRRRNPVTVPAQAERAFRAMSPLATAELGETGIRLPWSLLVSLGGATAGVFFLSVNLGGLRYHNVDPALFVLGCSLSLIPLAAGVAWWPVLRRTVTGGATARQLRLIGLVYLAAGTVGGLTGGIAALVASGGEGAFPGVLGICGVGGMLAWRGRVLSGFAKQAERSGIARS